MSSVRLPLAYYPPPPVSDSVRLARGASLFAIGAVIIALLALALFVCRLTLHSERRDDACDPAERVSEPLGT